jgi:hypothetical protein
MYNYKDLQKKLYPALRPKIYNPPAQIKQTLYTQSVSYAKITKQNSYSLVPLEEVSNTIQPHQQNSDMQELKEHEKRTLQSNGNHAKSSYINSHKTQIMTNFLKLTLWNTNGLTQHIEKPKTFLS